MSAELSPVAHLSAVAGMPPGPTGNTFGYVFVAQSTQHANYRSAENHIRELWWSWGSAQPGRSY